MKDKTIVSSAALITSLVAYWYARQINKDVVPYIMIGGFVGTLIGELLAAQKSVDP